MSPAPPPSFTQHHSMPPPSLPIPPPFYQYHHTMECKTHTIPHSYQYHITYHTIPYHLTSYPTIRSVWGPFTKYEKYFYRLQYLSLGFIFCGQVLQIFAVILSYKWRLLGEHDPLKISSIGLYPRFWPFTLWIIHHKLLKIRYLARSFD